MIFCTRLWQINYIYNFWSIVCYYISNIEIFCEDLEVETLFAILETMFTNVDECNYCHHAKAHRSKKLCTSSIAWWISLFSLCCQNLHLPRALREIGRRQELKELSMLIHNRTMAYLISGLNNLRFFFFFSKKAKYWFFLFMNIYWN